MELRIQGVLSRSRNVIFAFCCEFNFLHLFRLELAERII